MLTFLDHKGNEIGALTTFKYINAVNGERSLSGTVHGNLEIEKGWGVRFEDEYYKVIYAKPKSLGKINIVQFDAVHQFFWDFDKSSVYSELDGSYPFRTFLDHIFDGSGYRYNLEVEVGSLRKQNFGLKKRLELFNDLIKHAGVEFQVRGKVVRILERTGTDLSTVVRKKLNLNDLSIEKRIGDFITYQKGLGAWYDENDHSKGRLEVEYVSPLATIYGRLEGEPYVDERFTIAENFLGVLKKSVEDSYSISVQLSMEDLQKAGYQYTRPLAGDYITVIDEDINFKERVRIVSVETEYDIKGQVIDHTVTCNDIGSVKKQSVGYSSLKSSVSNVSKETESAIQTANKALVSADGKSTVYFGTEFPQDVPKGTLTKGDTLYLKVGDKTKMYYWNGAEWLEPPVVNDVEAFKESINTEIAQVNQSMQAQSEEHDRQVADILSKTQSVETLADQAKSDAASAIARANQVKTEAIADARAQIATVNQSLNTVRADLQNQVNAQSNLTNRVTTVENIANGTKTTVSELSKTVDKTTNDIASVTKRTKVVEDGLAGTKVDLSLVKINAEETQQNLATYQNTVDRKLDELTSSTQTLDGKINTASAKVDTVAGQIRTEISETKALIPTENGGNNLIIGSMTRLPTPYQQANLIFTKNQSVQEWQATDAVRVQGTKGSSNIFCYLSVGRSNYKSTSGVKYVHSIYIKNTGAPFQVSNNLRKTIDIATGETKRVVIFDVGAGTSYLQINFQQSGTGQLDFYYWHPQIETGTIVNDWSPAPEDLINELSSVKTTVTQTASGVEQLSTSLDVTDSKVSTAEAKIRNLVNEVSSKVSQTDYNTLTGRVDSAETAITQNAQEINKRLTSTQVDKAITDKGYQTKGDVDSNITGRGYITNSALQPYALSTTVQNLVKETADSFSRTISETKALIPTEVGGRNLLLNSSDFVGWSKRDSGATISDAGYNNSKAVVTADASSNGYYANTTKYLPLELNTNYVTSCWVFVRKRPIRCLIGFNNARIGNLNDVPLNKWFRVSKVFNTGASTSAYTSNGDFYLIATGGDVLFSAPKLETGTIPTDYTLAIEDLATVTALHDVKDTVSSHTRTIGAVGETGSILDNVSKVTQTANGLVTEVSGTNGLKTQVSTLAGSYAIKNLTKAGDVLGQINLNPDGSVRINEGLISVGERTYIQDGVISSAKIASLDAGKITTGYLAAARIATNSIDGSKLVFDQAFVNKMTANEALFKQLFAKSAFITSVQAVTLSASQITSGVMRATNGAMEVNLNAGQILYYTDQAALKRVLSGYPTQFVKFATGTVTGKGTAGVTVIGSNRRNSESSNDGGFVGIRAWNGSNIDQIDVVGDTVRLASSTFESADGWTVNTLPGKLDIDAFNADHRASSKIKVGDLWLWKNATTYSSMRDTINLIIDNLQLLHNNKSTERAYSYTLPAKV
ncbi:TPA: hypothetical protein U1C85_001880 [Streptococcus suis]|nr:hypothetical protein [Streptococcus suis]